MARRKILPRKEASRYDSVSFGSFPTDDAPFNDLKTFVITSSVIVDLTTGLPVTYVLDSAASASFKGAKTYTDLLLTEVSGVYATGSVQPGLFDIFLRLDPSISSSIEPFKEVSLFEQGNFIDPFYATGSLPEIGNGTFDSELKNKTKINLSFSINSKTTMLAKTSSIYYLNVKNGVWEIPSNASSEMLGPFEKIGVGTGVGTNSRGAFFIEDQVGFDAYGNCLISGSLDMFRNAHPEYSHSDYYLGKIYDRTTFADLITKDYPNSIQRNQKYDATSEQQFELPIDQPFLIEKIVYEMPFCFGNDWFLDKTTMFPITASLKDYINTNIAGHTGYGVGSLYDEGGPGISVSLFSQIPYGTGTIRDLVSHDLITHADDENTKLNVYTFNSGTASEAFHFIPVGVGAYTTPGAVVNGIYSGNKTTFTGSVVVKSTAAISNGIKMLIESGSELQSYASDSSDKFKSIFSIPYIDTDVRTTAMNPFGRGMTGFSPSGGSIFGGEYSLVQDSKIANSNTIKNPFFTSNVSEINNAYTLVSATLQQKPSRDCYLMLNNFYLSKKQSPYLIYPGQKLLLAVSKTRPIFRNISLRTNNTNITYARASLVSSSYYYTSPAGHDVQFNTGFLNITIYGSYVRADGAFIP